MYAPSKPYKTDIQKLIKNTWQVPGLTIQPGVYPISRSRVGGLEVDHTDGIGTKGYYHWHERTFKAAVLDSLAMNLNDLALMGAVPYKLQNHLTLPRDDHEAIVNIIKYLTIECQKLKIAITGGETSVHDNSDSLDISISMTGRIGSVVPNMLVPGTILIGLPSNGLHSNGFTLVRKKFKKEIRSEFTKPTKIYLPLILELQKSIQPRGMMHITGGAFTKLKDILKNADAIINQPLKPQKIFQELYAKNIKDEDMYRIFNCGTGFVIGVQPEDTAKTLAITKGKIIGKVTKGSGKVFITSAFSNKVVEY